MPVSHSLARRAPALGRPLSSLACTAALALSAGPALAQPPDLDRVEISGHVIEAVPRFDVHASCTLLEPRLQDELVRTWWLERSYGVMDVRFVVIDGKVAAVRTRGGMSFQTLSDVRRALHHLECPGAGTGTSIYRMQVVFADPDGMPDAAPGASPPNRVAFVETR